MKYLFRNIRFYILLLSFVLSILIYFSSWSLIQLVQTYALTAAFYLYLTLLAGPLCYTFKFLPFRMQYIKARRAIGFSAFYFGLLHALFAFFGVLGGFQSLPTLPGKYLIAISLSFTSLIILTIMAATAFDFMIEKLTFPRWKFLHRFVYLVGIFILIHALLIGSHFQKDGLIRSVSFVLIAFLIILEIPRVIIFIKSKINGKKAKN